ncbi:MAG: glycosyltransferase family 4 protein [Nitrosomonas sp.]|nr:MAG: glycosyltransferase family 4 protein [Nitrosomonas sp.]
MSTVQRVPTIYLCGPIAEPGKPAKGGFQSCNRRTIDTLVGRGVEVHILPYAQPETRGIRKLIEYASGFTKLAWKVLCCKHGSILHLTGLFGPFIAAEIVLIHFAHWRGCLVIYDLRAGSGELHYRRRGPIYRRCFAHAMRAADLVMVEGHKLMGFVESLTGKPPVFFPNHIDTSAIPPRLEAAATEHGAPIIGYAGSLNPEKGIRTILEASRILTRSGMNVEVRLAGIGPKVFLDELRGEYADVRISWLGALPGDQVLELFRTAHFFMFPTVHRGEGQSNALTEAMACGCVPIASDHGFNTSVVGDCGAILAPQSDAERYANALREIWESGRWHELSQQSQRRIREQFSSPAVIDGLLRQYQSLGSGL